MGWVAPTDPVLNRVATPVSIAQLQEPAMQARIDELLEFAGAKTVPGKKDRRKLVGVAATQVGWDAAIAIVDKAKPGMWSGELMVLVAPRIVRMYGGLVRWWHGCYSCGPLYGTLALPSIMEVRALDRYGQEQHLTFEGTRPVHVAWHEIMHLMGHRFPDTVYEQGGELHVVWPHEIWAYGLDAEWPRRAPRALWPTMKDGRPWKGLLL